MRFAKIALTLALAGQQSVGVDCGILNNDRRGAQQEEAAGGGVEGEPLFFEFNDGFDDSSGGIEFIDEEESSHHRELEVSVLLLLDIFLLHQVVVHIDRTSSTCGCAAPCQQSSL